jgi:predicted nucleic acid-binding protein
MKAFIDTNILLDYLVSGRPLQKDAIRIFEGARRNYYNLVLTTQSIIDAAYVSKKSGAELADISNFFDWLTLHINMEAIDSFDIREALKSEDPDFEDASQFAHAESSRCDFFITSDKKLLEKKSDNGMTVLSPTDFVSRMM